MAGKYLLLDSSFRDRIQYPNPANFMAKAADMKNINSRKQTNERKVSVELINLVVPVGLNLENLPYIVVELTNTDRPNHGVTSTNNLLIANKATFPVFMKDIRVLTDFVQIEPKIKQSILFRIDNDIIMTLYDNLGNVILIPDSLPPAPIIPTEQVSALYKIYDTDCPSGITPENAK